MKQPVERQRGKCLIEASPYDTGNQDLPDDDHVVSGSPSVIASGLLTAPAADHEHPKTGTATFVFANGTVDVRHSPGKDTQSFNSKTCLRTVSFHGAYNITGGTGAYQGAAAAATTSWASGHRRQVRRQMLEELAAGRLPSGDQRERAPAGAAEAGPEPA